MTDAERKAALLEDVASLDLLAMPTMQAAKIYASIAVSLKRIADAMETQSAHAELLAAAKKALAVIEPMAWQTHMKLEVPRLQAAIRKVEELAS